MIKLGDMSVLRPTWKIPPNKIHTYKNPLKNVNVYYMRDCGEKDCYPYHTKNWDEFLSLHGKPYNYLMYYGEWYMDVYGGSKYKLKDYIKNNVTQEEYKNALKTIKRYEK